MNTQHAVTDADRQFASEVERSLRTTFPAGKVVPFEVATWNKAADPESLVERRATAHLQAIPKSQKCISDTKKGLKATIASIAAARREEKARHAAMLAELAEREADAKKQAKQDIAAYERLVASSQAALEALTAD